MGFAATCVLILVSALFCETTVYCASIRSSGPGAQPKPKGFGTAKRAIIIGIDGFGGSHFRNATGHYLTLKSFIEQGSYTTRARGVFPTKSGPNWSTYLTGMNVMEHGVFDNDWKPANGNPQGETSYSIPPVTGRGLPQTMFTQVKKKDPNLQTAMMFTWKWLEYYAFNNTDIDVWHWGGDGITCGSSNNPANCYHLKDLNTMIAAKANLIRNNPILTFIHFDLLDIAGHATCWGCIEYYKALKSVEMKIKLLMNELSQAQDSSGEPMLNGTLIVIASDHGGWRNTHDFQFQPFSALIDIPLLIRGPGVLKNNSLEGMFVSSLDVVPTVLNAIGVEKSEFMSGRVLEQIYL